MPHFHGTMPSSLPHKLAPSMCPRYPELEAQLHVMLMDKLSPSIQSLTQMIDVFIKIHSHSALEQLLQIKEVGARFPYYITTHDGTEQEYLPMQNVTHLSHSMIGKARMNNLHQCLDSIVADKVPGDLIETGVWRGGATIFMRGYLKAHNVRGRKVWVADSFAGLPKPALEQDQGWDLSSAPYPCLAVSEGQVRALFERYDLLDDRVRFLKGWFKDTLHRAPIRKLALLRLDGDLYESTMDALTALYDKVSVGGYIIVDDYNALPQCAVAVNDFRQSRSIEDPILVIDDASVYWRKSAE